MWKRPKREPVEHTFSGEKLTLEPVSADVWIEAITALESSESDLDALKASIPLIVASATQNGAPYFQGEAVESELLAEATKSGRFANALGELGEAVMSAQGLDLEEAEGN